MRENDIRIAIVVSDENRELLRGHYDAICADAVIYDNPTQTIVVLRERWEKVPDFASRICPDEVKVYDTPPEG
jgi:hypothetical protein